MLHEKFHYQTLEELLETAKQAEGNIPVSDNMDVLFEPVDKNGIHFENRFAIQPMEGCDAAEDGTPGELTTRRYDRFARSGAGLIWAEAVAILPEGRAKPRQLHMKDDNLDGFKRMVEDIKETSMREHGFAPVVIMQAAHSGRYSNPNGYSEPIIAYNNPLFEKDKPIDPSRIITDDEVKRLEERYAWAARNAEACGFDGVDIKSCHRYLLSEFLSAYHREGEYGGCFENRIRLLRNAIRNAMDATGKDFIVTSRLNVYDGFPYPYGFGVKDGEGIIPDLTEGKKLVDILCDDLGVRMLDITIGNPYVNPHVNRPYDRGNYVPEEHPLFGLGRIMDCVTEIQKHRPDLLVVGSGFSYPRQFSAQLAAGMIERGGCTVAGFGRMAFAYPDFIQDIKKNGCLNSKKCCVSCGECAKLLRAGQASGCVVRDNQLYRPHKD
ncbi:MAG: NADH:flavin oxidoreductase [Oscillospiraceae bacterium]|nr:NADH:flavin oxidoreductase [Oscillospiraceae bacterium]